MGTENQLRHGSRCVILMHVHWVFVTKYRRGVLTAQILHDLRSNFASVCLDFESQLVEFDGDDDHVHLLVNYPPTIAVAALVNSLKGLSGDLASTAARHWSIDFGATNWQRGAWPRAAGYHPALPLPHSRTACRFPNWDCLPSCFRR